jgi:hypothetical protein
MPELTTSQRIVQNKIEEEAEGQKAAEQTSEGVQTSS